MITVYNSSSDKMEFHSNSQHTIASEITCSGIGLHSGETVAMKLCPAPANAGIIFVRSDIDGGSSPRSKIAATYDMVTETTLGTTITNRFGVKTSTIEHLMAALWGLGVDNAIIELDAPEVPIMDGSSEPFIFLIECAGIRQQNAARKFITIDQEIKLSDGDSVAVISPHDGFIIDIDIDFSHDKIAQQNAKYDFDEVSFKQNLSRARTFGFKSDVDKLKSMGLILGGSLDNAIVLDDDKVINEGGLRFDDEFIRHKALDCVGDYFLAGMRIKGHITTSKPGHGVNNKLIHAIFANQDYWHLDVPHISESINEQTNAFSLTRACVSQGKPAHLAGGAGLVSSAVMSPEK